MNDASDSDLRDSVSWCSSLTTDAAMSEQKDVPVSRAIACTCGTRSVVIGPLV